MESRNGLIFSFAQVECPGLCTSLTFCSSALWHTIPSLHRITHPHAAFEMGKYGKLERRLPLSQRTERRFSQFFQIAGLYMNLLSLSMIGFPGRWERPSREAGWDLTGQISWRLLWTDPTRADKMNRDNNPYVGRMKELGIWQDEGRIFSLCERTRWTHNQRVTGTLSIHTLHWLLEQATERAWECFECSYTIFLDQ